MKATGIVRRIDDLGRVVIPKEIRHNLGIKEGDPLEIFISSDGEVIFKKYGFSLDREIDHIKRVLTDFSDDYNYTNRINNKLSELKLIVKEQYGGNDND